MDYGDFNTILQCSQYNYQMCSILKQNKREEEDTTTLTGTGRSNRRFFKRQPSETSHSNESRRSAHKSTHRDSSHKLSYIRMPLQSLSSAAEIQQTLPYSMHQQSNRLSHLGKKIVVAGSINCVGVLQKRVESLESELGLKGQELELVEEERQKTKDELDKLVKKHSLLEDTHKGLLATNQVLKQTLRKATVESRRLEQQKESLNKKIVFLEKVQFTSDTKNIQTLRETHLQHQLESFKTKLKESKSEIQSLLESQLQQLRQEVFTSKKLIESLQINNDCLQKKLDSTNYLVSQEDNYNALKTKYRKFLGEYKDLKRIHEVALKENKMLRTQIKGQIKEDQSLELSLYSIMN